VSIFLQDLLLVGVGLGQWVGLENETLIVQAWSEVVTADFSHNHINSVDESIVGVARFFV
jgi:hypothetical protein